LTTSVPVFDSARPLALDSCHVGRTTYDEVLFVGAVNWIADVDTRKRLT
jgi:hypothetical protein